MNGTKSYLPLIVCPVCVSLAVLCACISSYVYVRTFVCPDEGGLGGGGTGDRGNFKENAFPFATVVLELFSVYLKSVMFWKFQGGIVGEGFEGQGNRWKEICTQV